MAPKRKGRFKIRLYPYLERDAAILEWFGSMGKRSRSKQAKQVILKAIAMAEGSVPAIRRPVTLEIYLRPGKEPEDRINDWLEAIPKRRRGELVKDILFRAARPAGDPVLIKVESDKAGKVAKNIFKSIFRPEQ